ncbi:MAG TPA: hypothetical protein VHG92_08845 [Afifellaceae bacterium]|nr:hypothetical protein [Afifellaceae bacterium]
MFTRNLDERRLERRKVLFHNAPDDAVVNFVIAVPQDIPDALDLAPRELRMAFLN